MTEKGIKANHLDIYTDIFGLKEDFKKVQKPINDVVGNLFGTPLVAGMTLAEISEFIGNHTHSANVANNFVSAPATSTMTLKDISIFMTKQLVLGNIVNNVLGITSMSETSLTGPTLAEIESAIDEQKLTSEIINKFFEGSKPQDITTTFSYIDRRIKNQVQLGINNLLSLFFFNREAR